MDELSQLTNGVVFGLEKRIAKPPKSQTQADLWEVLKALAPPDCPSMQADVKAFCKKLRYNRDLKLKMYSKNIKDWYTKSFVFPPTPKEVTKSDGKLAAKENNKKQVPALQIYLFRSIMF